MENELKINDIETKHIINVVEDYHFYFYCGVMGIMFIVLLYTIWEFIKIVI